MKWVIFEFLRCVTVRPFNSHPRIYWNKNKQKFISLWKLKERLDGELILVNYEDSREQFLKIEVLDLNPEGIQDEKVERMDKTEFSSYFREVNRRARGSTNNSHSKPISKPDEGSKKLIIDILDGELTGGFDVDSIYLIGDDR